ncbi:MAG: hypothetical protein WA744_14535, partial [Candidatus Acidiferrales bacterium]
MATLKLSGIIAILTCAASLVAGIGTPTAPQRTEPVPPGQAKTSVGEKEPATRGDFLGDADCQECHQDIGNTYARTAHHLTSQLPTEHSILGSFTSGENILKTGDPDLHFRMDVKESGFYETAVFWQPPDQKTRTERIDIVTGSGEKGQTYLYWKGDQLFQLPVSYWTALK